MDIKDSTTAESLISGQALAFFRIVVISESDNLTGITLLPIGRVFYALEQESVNLLHGLPHYIGGSNVELGG